MKPVAVIRHARSEGPAYFASFLESQSIPVKLIAIDEGASVPRDAAAFSGIAMMGGPMGVNDDLPWIAPELALIRDAVAKDVPTIGHCLGGQLMSRAFGGEVTANKWREIGWGAVRVCDNSVARRWFGDDREFLSFHWHGDTFSIPPGATRILENGNCANQGFAIGKHLGLQTHVEMTEDLIRVWCRGGRQEIEAHASSPGVQPVSDIEASLEERVEALHRIADRLYERWIAGLTR